MGAQRWAKQANGNGIYEVAYLMEAFQEMNMVDLEMAWRVTGFGRAMEMSATVTAWPRGEPSSVVNALASASVRCSTINLQTAEAVAIHLLYMLDGALDRRETAEKKPE